MRAGRVVAGVLVDERRVRAGARAPDAVHVVGAVQVDAEEADRARAAADAAQAPLDQLAVAARLRAEAGVATERGARRALADGSRPDDGRRTAVAVVGRRVA